MAHTIRSLSLQTEVNREELLRILLTNRDQHKQLWADAFEGYRKAVLDKLERTLAQCRSGRVGAVSIHLSPPEDHTKTYNTAIGMIEHHVHPTVVLTAAEYRMFVEDEWDWMDSWLVSNAGYSQAVASYALSKGLE